MISDIRASQAVTNGRTAPASSTSANSAKSAEPRDSVHLSPGDERSLEQLRQAVAEEAQCLEKKLPEHVPGELLVRTKEGVSSQDFQKLAGFYRFNIVEKYHIPDDCRKNGLTGELYRVKGNADIGTAEGIALMGHEPGVQYAASNDILYAIEAAPGQKAKPKPQEKPQENIPNDLDSRLWGLKNSGQDGGKSGADISATRAWTISTGQRDGGPIIAVIDTGMDYTHPELQNNVWNNPDPTAPDRHGYNFVANSPDPMDDHSHGTHVSGTIAAEGNNGQGIVGVNWQARVMACKFLNANGSGSTADAVRAVLYATDHGARITSNSWGGGGYNAALYDTLKASPALHIFAAGNSHNDNDQSPAYPASYDLDNIVAVAASDHMDLRASFSNYGKKSVDLAAPGKDIYSSVPHNRYDTYSGTSMATPHVSGAAALIASAHPGITNAQLKARLIYGVDHLDSWKNLVLSKGRLNAFSSNLTDEVAPDAPQDFAPVQAGATKVVLGWTATGDDGSTGNASAYDLRFSEHEISEDPKSGDNTVSFQDAMAADVNTPSAPGTKDTAVLLLPPSGNPRTLHVALKVIDKVGNCSPLVKSTVDVPAATVAFEDNMENGTANWTADSPWALVDEPGHGKVWCSAPSGSQANNANVSITTKPIKLDLKGSTLNYLSKINLEDGYDFLNTEVSEDGKNWKPLDQATGSSDWRLNTLDLSAFDGRTVQLRWRVNTDASVSSVGVRIDDVAIAGDAARSAQ